MYPDKTTAHAILDKAHDRNPGPWKAHSMVAAKAAELLAEALKLDSEKAYVCGLLHDIGRHFGVGHLRHVLDGYRYMMELGYDEIARICLTHSFITKDLSHYVGRIDISPQDYQWLADEIERIEYDDYDRLIQLCDNLADAGGVVSIEERMDDVARRYGNYHEAKRIANRQLLAQLASQLSHDPYDLLTHLRK